MKLNKRFEIMILTIWLEYLARNEKFFIVFQEKIMEYLHRDKGLKGKELESWLNGF